jgi:hypothetical protein
VELHLLHRTFAGDTARGLLVIHRRLGSPLRRAFRELLRQEFPLASVRPIWEFAGSDSLSMAANNTTGFDCRVRTGDRTQLSQHAYGLAVDINPAQNPFVQKRISRAETTRIQTSRTDNPGPASEKLLVTPAAGRDYLDRTVAEPGKILRRDSTWWVLRSAELSWGGTWRRHQDYQHWEVDDPPPGMNPPPSP